MDKKIGYKGFDKDLKCRDQQYKIGVIYSKGANNEVIETPYSDNNLFELKQGSQKQLNLCSNSVFHYCATLGNVLKNWYKPIDGNRFCKIEIIGDYCDSSDKSGTTAFRIIKELSVGEVLKISEEEKAKTTLANLESNLSIKEVQLIQEKYPMLHIGGSVGLYLHGVRLDRWSDTQSSDLDFVSPYYIKIDDNEQFSVDGEDYKPSGNDFDNAMMVGFNNGKYLKLDYKIDPYQKYEIINYNGFNFKVSTLEQIMEAKIRYALKGQDKHKNDIKEICTNKKQKTIKYGLQQLWN